MSEQSFSASPCASVKPPAPICERKGKGRPRCFDHNQALHRALTLFWQKGYEATSIADLCKAMQIRPPSLYADFGNKASLFIEALQAYETTYWRGPSQRFLQEADMYQAVREYFATAAGILRSPDAPCGCMVVLGAMSIDNQPDILAAVTALREGTKQLFEKRLERAVADGQIPKECNVQILASALNTFLEGLTIQARSGISQDELQRIAACALQLLPQRQVEP